VSEDTVGVSWREFVAARTAERRITEEAVARLDQAANDAKERAELALSSAEKATDKHNELIRKMENERAEFARSDSVNLMREDINSLRGALAKIVGASVAGSVMLAVIINLLIRLASGG
jgi:hypothetical protein